MVYNFLYVIRVLPFIKYSYQVIVNEFECKCRCCMLRYLQENRLEDLLLHLLCQGLTVAFLRVYYDCEHLLAVEPMTQLYDIKEPESSSLLNVSQGGLLLNLLSPASDLLSVLSSRQLSVCLH